MSDKLRSLRKEIDCIDHELAMILSKRFKLTKQVGLIKAENALPAIDLKREDDKFEQIKLLSYEANVSEELLKQIFRVVIDEVVKQHREIANK